MNSITSKEPLLKEIINYNHHAFLINTSNREVMFESLKEEIKKISSNSFFLNLKLLDIEKARQIIEDSKAKSEKMRFILLSFFSIGREAQNALLKFLEETPENTKIILISSPSTKILSTVKSRLYTIDFKEVVINRDIELVQKFLKTKKLNRVNLKEIKDLLAKKDEYALEVEGKDRQDRESVEIFLNSLYQVLAQEFIINLKTNNKKDLEIRKEILSSLDDLSTFLKYIKNNSSSSKTILEYLSLKLPEIAIDI
jgi:DNA polymerase III delta prime subunit